MITAPTLCQVPAETMAVTHACVPVQLPVQTIGGIRASQIAVRTSLNQHAPSPSQQDLPVFCVLHRWAPPQSVSEDVVFKNHTRGAVKGPTLPMPCRPFAGTMNNSSLVHPHLKAAHAVGPVPIAGGMRTLCSRPRRVVR
jgi:hypothetical protein